MMIETPEADDSEGPASAFLLLRRSDGAGVGRSESSHHWETPPASAGDNVSPEPTPNRRHLFGKPSRTAKRSCEVPQGSR